MATGAELQGVAKSIGMFERLSTTDALLLATALIAGGILMQVCTRLLIDALTAKKGAENRPDYAEMADCKKAIEDLKIASSNMLKLCEDNRDRLAVLENTKVAENTCTARLHGVQAISKMHYSLLKGVQQDVQDVRSDIKDVRNAVASLTEFLATSRRRFIKPDVVDHPANSQRDSAVEEDEDDCA